MIQRQGGTGVVLRLMIFAGVLLTSLPVARSIAATSPSVAEAIRAQRLRLETAPGDVVVLNDLANLLVLVGDVEEAEELYQQALEIEPDRIPTLYNLALLRAETGRRKLAIRGFRNVLETDPRHAWSHYQLGTLTAAAGNRNKAIGHYTEAFRLEPRLATAEFNPHAIDNDLLLAALLQAHGAGSPANVVPRIYKDAERVRVLLLPPAAGTRDSAESGESAPRGGGAIRSSGGRPGAQAGEMGGPVSEAREPERIELETESGAVPSGASAQGDAGRRPAPSGQTTRQPVTPVPAAAPADSSGAAAAGEVVPPQSAAQPPELPSTAPPAPEFEPVFGSTGRLDLRLVPKPQDRLASLADAPR